MANSVDFIRRQIKITPTPKDKGVETTIRLRIYDNGMVGFNDQDFKSDDVSPILSLGRQLLQVLEELEFQASKRRAKKASAA